MIVEHFPDKSGHGPGHNIRLSEKAGAYCDCKAAQFNKKCWAVKAHIQLHNIPADVQKDLDDQLTISRKEAYEQSLTH